MESLATSGSTRMRSTKASGKTIKPVATASTPTPTALNTKVSGKTTSNTGKVKKPGPTTPNTKVTTLKARNTAGADSSGKTNPNMKVNGEMTTIMVKEHITTPMVIFIVESGEMVLNTAKVHMNGNLGIPIEVRGLMIITQIKAS